MEFSKLNIFGESKPKSTMPYLSPKNKGQQVLEVTYGHNDNGGKRYTYVGNTHRTGDIVTPFVTHPTSGKTYRTLAVVRATHNLNAGQEQLNALANSGIRVKKIGDTHQAWLPGYQQRKAQDSTFTAKKWAQEAQMRKVNHLGEVKND